jgi:hypothetical protein
MDRVEGQRRLINLEGSLGARSLAFNPARDPMVEQAKFPGMVALYWGLVDGNGCPPTQRGRLCCGRPHSRKRTCSWRTRTTGD